ADFFARRMAREMAEDFPGFSPSAIAAMEAHDWPGNVRELRNFAQRLTYRAISDHSTDPIQFDPAAIDPFASPWRPSASLAAPATVNKISPSAVTPPPPPVLDIPFEDQIRVFETSLIDTALSAHEGHQGKAAKSLGLSYHQFRGLLKKYGYGKGASKPEEAPRGPIRGM
ncbi:MAG: helix-turn-helix domain-containing protein, partial [Pseudomonadota bacterium]